MTAVRTVLAPLSRTRAVTVQQKKPGTALRTRR